MITLILLVCAVPLYECSPGLNAGMFFGQNVNGYSPFLPVSHLFLLWVLAWWVDKVTLPVCHSPCHGRAASMPIPGNEDIPFAQGKQH